MKIQNTRPAAVVLDGRTVIAPLAVVEVADNHGGALDLIGRGVLRRVEEKPKSDNATRKKAD